MRSGSTGYGYYSSDGSNWTLLETYTIFTDDIYICLRLLTQDSSPTCSWTFDNFKINSGTIVWPEITHPNCKKIAITKSDGTTQIYGEIEQWNAANEKALIWVSKDDLILSASTATELYLYYDSNQPDNTTYIGEAGDTAAQNVWNSNFAAVYTMSQDPSVGTDCILDSTSNANHLTTHGSMSSADLVSGSIGKALNLNGSNDYLSSKLNWQVSNEFALCVFLNLMTIPLAGLYHKVT